MYKIGILFQNRDFEHDVYELIKAFYPGNEIVSFMKRMMRIMISVSGSHVMKKVIPSVTTTE